MVPSFVEVAFSVILPGPVQVLRDAIVTVAGNQPELFILKVGERAVAAQIGWAFSDLVTRTQEWQNWSVDLEYDREGLVGELKLRYDLESPQPRHHAADGFDRPSRLGVPDIVLHHRGIHGPGDNLLVVEIKRTYRIFSKGSIDRMKVNEFMDRHGYQYGCLVGLGSRIGACNPKISWRKLADAQWTTIYVNPQALSS